MLTGLVGRVEVGAEYERGGEFEGTGEADNTSKVGGGPLNAAFLRFELKFPKYFLELVGTYDGGTCETTETESENVVTCEPDGGIAAGAKTQFFFTGSIAFDAPLGLAMITGKAETELFNPHPDGGNFTATTMITQKINRDQAATIVEDQLTSLCPDKRDLETAWAFIPQQPFMAGSQLTSNDPSEFDVTLDKDVWFAMLQCSPNIKYVQPTYFIRVEEETVEEEPDVQIDEVNWWPLHDGLKVWAGYGTLLETEDRIFGEDPEPSGDEMDTVIDPVDTPAPTPERTCAILVSGEGEDETEQGAFNFDVDLMRTNLMREMLGPQLSEDDIVVMENPTREEVEAKLASLKDQYSKIYFYYSGHGTKLGMSTRGEGGTLLFITVANLLYDSNAPNLCVMIDACESGGAGSLFKFSRRFKERNITLITASDSVKPAITTTLYKTADNTRVRGSIFTYTFALGFGDPKVDANGDGETSLAETFNWVREQNPELARGKVNDRMNPQMCVNEVVDKPMATVISSPSTGLTVTQNTPVDPEGSLELEVRSGVTGFDEFDSSSVIEVSPGRTWTIGGSVQVEDFDLSVQFKYTPGQDFTIDEETSPGLATRPFDPGKRSVQAWTAHLPTVWDPEGQTITAHHVTQFGDWAIARTVGASAVATENTEPLPVSYALDQNYPNPFNPTTTIRYDVSQAGVVNIVVVDLLGRLVTRLVNERVESGAHLVTWDGRTSDGAEAPSGMYMYQMRVADFQSNRKMLLLR